MHAGSKAGAHSVLNHKGLIPCILQLWVASITKNILSAIAVASMTWHGQSCMPLSAVQWSLNAILAATILNSVIAVAPCPHTHIVRGWGNTKKTSDSYKLGWLQSRAASK